MSLAALDGNPFAPLDDAAVKQEAKSAGNLFRNAWFGRRDLIPPVDDPRTLLIDRAIVAHGLLTPEQLTEIHEVGRQMDLVRPNLAQAGAMVERAVKRSKEEREALKLQKKAEAAERRRLRAEAVAHRRDTDIIFLGRGVSKGLADRRSNVELLQRQGLPVVGAPAEIAQALGLSISKLRWLAYHSDAATRVHYIRFTVPKKSGGVRELAAPHRMLGAAQRWILDNILAKVATHDAAHGFTAGRSTVTNAAPHVGRSVVVNADLKDFFPTITFVRVKGIFQSLGYSPAAATIFALLCTEAPRKSLIYDGKSFAAATGPRVLPQGACTSPALSNLTSRRFDARLRGISAKLGWTYTRYADDLTFSAGTASAGTVSADSTAAVGDANAKVGYLLARIRHIAQDEGFAVNEKKTRVQRRNASQRVTGLVVNDHVAVPRDMVRRLRAILHRARTTGLAAQNRENHPHFEAWVRGMIAYVAMSNAEQGRKLRLAYDALAHG
jgi:RNA-directed DNA polymerase